MNRFAIATLTAWGALSGSLLAENVITMGYGEGRPGDRDVRVVVTATNALPIQGYSIAFTYPTSALTCTEITTSGSHVSCPEFLGSKIIDGLGVGTLGVILDFNEGPFSLDTEVPSTGPGDYPRVIARLTFDVKANAPGGVYPLRLVDGVGTPAVSNRFSHEGQSIEPRLVSGTFTVEGGNVLRIEKKQAFPGATPNLPILVYAQHPDPIDGFQVAFAYNKAALTLRDLDPQAAGIQNATYLGTELGFLLGAAKIEAFNFDVDLNFSATQARASCAVLFDFAPPFDGQQLPPAPTAPGQSILKLTFSVTDAADDQRQWQDLDLADVAVPGAVDNRFVIGGASIDPRLVDGKIYFSEGGLTGKVIDSVTKAGVGGVRVTTDPDAFTTTTAPDGSFTLTGVIPGTYTLILSKAPSYYASRHSLTESGQPIVVQGSGVADPVGNLPIFLMPPGECTGPVEPPVFLPFIRGNVNGARTDLSDTIYLLQFMFQGGPAPRCLQSGDTNDDNRLDISDSIYLLAYLFSGGPSPAPPFSLNGTGCAKDVLTPGGNLDCKEFDSCAEE